MADAESRLRLGKIISGIGSVWIALYFLSRFLNVGGTPLGDILAFFGSTFFIPIALLFTGRAIKRRSRQVTMEDALGSGTVATERSIPAPSPPSEPRSSPPPEPAPPEPLPRPAPPEPPSDTSSRPVDMDELAEAIGFDSSDDSDAASDSMEESVGPMTSEEMIADAHRRNEN